MNNAENTRALMLHIMKMKQQQHAIGDAIKRSITWYRQNNASEKAAKSDIVQMTETRIYIGLNDGETGEQLYETEKYLEQMKEICVLFHQESVLVTENQLGGYFITQESN